ncbi:NAD-dependent epimerase/dehydratase family protein [Polluticaenibacter yanchengensis]|uniref:NAD-dependent epimerase/dehydratase family protein n=1 Tax=Polluticaenibacter yanchengensis TaxID=3014562 RepID=A0ABT4UMU2_9BACT|nr:NAD-dependent epimerase/dehydratase family protein [Chitinophagaceae bacterium LY-5]
MVQLKVILTGATGMVGEGVLLHCLQNIHVSEVLIVSRKSYPLKHPKLRELIVKDFNLLSQFSDQITGYDTCFYCAGISSVGMNETDYTAITYTTTLNFAKSLLAVNPKLTFHYVSGAHTNANGSQMWQRVKGNTENALARLGFKAAYNYRPGFMKPVAGQKNVRWFFKPIIAVYPVLFPKKSLTLHQVAQAMINISFKDYPATILEVKDMNQAAQLSI